jgi:UDP-N-acetylmuramoyl-tripeptide--D-alanyl-D-alanine ligase
VIAMTLGEIAAVVGGVVDPSEADTVVSAEAFVDSRAPVAGGLFVALAGERVDGHAYAGAAVQGGAAGVLASEPVAVPAVVVDDVLGALGTLAGQVMQRLPDAKVAAITGSQGKTSTKDMLAHILAAQAPTVSSLESQNNELGVPLTALRVRPDTRYVVCEMGARGLGHIAFLAAIMRPQVGLVLNVGVAHLGEFGSQDGIAAAKGELVEALPSDGLAVLNADDPRVISMAARTSAAVLTFGRAESADLRLTSAGVDGDGHTRLRLEWRGEVRDITLGYVGEHHAMNAAAATAAALGLGLRLDDAAESLDGATPQSKWRMAVATSPDGVVVINDAYNANPDSMRAAVKALADIASHRPGARTVAVLGEMRELGDASSFEHQELGRLVAATGVERLVVVGEAARPMIGAARADRSWAGTAEFAADPEQALSLMRDALREGDVVLVKASRATGLEGLAAALLTGWPRQTRTDRGR